VVRVVRGAGGAAPRCQRLGATLHLDRLIEEGDTVVAVGSGEMTLEEAGRVAFVFTEIFSFTDDRISRLETFHINLGGPGDTLFTTSTG
jgi:ketosteroid isomerase-like protein